jgi:probable phosphoglycerate mutase
MVCGSNSVPLAFERHLQTSNVLLDRKRAVKSDVTKVCETERRKVSLNEAMSNELPVIYLARHGETAWSLTGQHTGLTDLPLTERGERNARALRERLSGLHFAKVLTSPLQRASRTCELAGFGTVAEVDRDLVEWNYGQYEGLRTAEIYAERPGWDLFRDGCPGGESPDQVGARANNVLSRVRAVGADVLLFSSGHFLRVLAARWLGLEPAGGRYLLLSTASLSALAYEHNPCQPMILLWNDTRHVNTIPTDAAGMVSSPLEPPKERG